MPKMRKKSAEMKRSETREKRALLKGVLYEEVGTSLNNIAKNQDSRSTEVEALFPITSIKQEPVDSEFSVGLAASQVNSTAEGYPSFPKTLTKSYPEAVSGDKNMCQSLEDLKTLPTSANVESEETNTSLMEVYCTECGEGFMYFDQIQEHKNICTGKQKPLHKTNYKRKKRKAPNRTRSIKGTKQESTTKATKVIKGLLQKSRKGIKNKKGVVYSDTAVKESKLYECDHCGKNYMSAPKLWRHYKTHTEEIRKETENKLNSLISMYSVYDVENEIKKEQPDEDYNDKESDNDHERISKEYDLKTNNGDVSSKSKRKKHNRKVHPLRITNGPQRNIPKSRWKIVPCRAERKPRKKLLYENKKRSKGGHQCSYCLKVFNYPGVLRNHERTHTGEKPYKCVDCPKAFADCSAFRRHKKIHEKDRIKAAKEYYNDGIEKGLDFKDPEVLKAADEKSAELGKMVRLIASGAKIEQIKYNCEICQEGLCNKYDYVKHMENHTGERPYKCVICNKGFLTKSHLRSHEFIHTGETPFACSYCDKKFNTRKSLRRHEALHSGAKICKCKSCDESFNTRYQLRKHIDSVHDGVRPYQCHMCAKGFLVSSHLTEHERTHTKERPFMCSFCDKSFSAANSRKRHEKIHTNDRAHKCAICDKAFIVAGDLKKHMRTHSDERPFVCDIPGCDKSYKFISDLRVHKHRHNNPNFEKNGSFPCSKCDLVFNEVAERQAHVKVAHPKKRTTTNRPVCCQYCGKEFMSSSYLKIHERTHTGESFQCEFCGKEYIDQRLLKFHILTHTGEKPYSCEYCGKTTARLSEMKVHTRVHTGETPYKCQFCDKAFSDSSARRVHEKRHTGEKNYKCSVCHKCFVTGGSLRKHLKAHVKGTDKSTKTKIIIHFPKHRKNKVDPVDISDTESDVSDIIVYADNSDDDVMAPPKQKDGDEEDKSDIQETYDSDVALYSEDDDTTKAEPVGATMIGPDSDEEMTKIKSKIGKSSRKIVKSALISSKKDISHSKGINSVQNRKVDDTVSSNNIVSTNVGAHVEEPVSESEQTEQEKNAVLKVADTKSQKKDKDLSSMCSDVESISTLSNEQCQSKNSSCISDLSLTHKQNAKVASDHGNTLESYSGKSNIILLASNVNLDHTRQTKIESRFNHDGNNAIQVGVQSPDFQSGTQLSISSPDLATTDHHNSMSRTGYSGYIFSSTKGNDVISTPIRSNMNQFNEGSGMEHRMSQSILGVSDSHVKSDHGMSIDRNVQSPSLTHFHHWHQPSVSSSISAYNSPTHQTLQEQRSLISNTNNKLEINRFQGSPIVSHSPYSARDSGSISHLYSTGLPLNLGQGTAGTPVYSPYLSGNFNCFGDRTLRKAEDQQQQQQQSSAGFSSSVVGFSALQ